MSQTQKTATTAAPTAPSLVAGHINRWANQPEFGVKRKLWRKDDDHAGVADTAFAEVRKVVLLRDVQTCRFCGFKAEKYQEVHHLDDNHQNNALENLLTVCNLCHQVHHLGMCAMRNGGFIAVIPELTQTEVNNIVRAIHGAPEVVTDSDIHDKLKSLYALFQMRGADTLKSLFGIDISIPLVFAEVLSVCPDVMYSMRSTAFAQLRLVGTKESFHDGQLEYYAGSRRAMFNPENWSALSNQLLT